MNGPLLFVAFATTT